jgi:uncharacterized protein with PQ loop repeat
MELFMILVSIFMSFMVIPHILKMIKTKSSKDQSLLGIIGVAAGIVCWIIYGLVAPDPTIVWCNLIMLTTYLGYIGTVIFYRTSYGQPSSNEAPRE